jgi:hypothetical protein
MKLHVVKQGEPTIDGYKRVELAPGTMFFGLEDVLDNEAQEIFANDILDAIPLGLTNQVLSQLVSKLRVNGKLIVGGTEFRVFLRACLNQSISEPSAMETIRVSQSMVNLQQLCGLLSNMGLEVELSNINGVHCEVRCVRK